MSERVCRFYDQARAADDGAGIMLDARRLRTPGNAVFAAPTRALAEAIAAEWSGQGEFIDATGMPLTQLAFAAIDHTPQRRGQLSAYIAKFGETDLVCHRAASPPELVARQAQAWDPLVAWAEGALGVSLPVVTGVLATDVPAIGLEKLRAHGDAADDFSLTALAQAAGLAGSAVIAYALLHGRLDAAAAFEAAALDDLWSLDKWGEDAAARARLDRQRAEFENVARFISLLSGGRR